MVTTHLRRLWSLDVTFLFMNGGWSVYVDPSLMAMCIPKTPANAHTANDGYLETLCRPPNALSWICWRCFRLCVILCASACCFNYYPPRIVVITPSCHLRRLLQTGLPWPYECWKNPAHHHPLLPRIRLYQPQGLWSIAVSALLI